MRTRPHQNVWSSGELDELLHTREDFLRHQTGLAKCRGFIPLRQGGFTRAPGTIYRGTTRNNLKARRVRFEFAANDALSLEFTDEVMRVWRYGALVMDGASPYELATPYTEDDLPNLQWAQDKDVIYFVDGRQPMQKLSRFALDNWSIEPVSFETGPFRVQNLDEAKTIQCSAASGSITISGTGDIFDPTWVGSLIQIEPTDITTIPNWVGNVTFSVGNRVVYDEKIYEMTVGVNTGSTPPVHTYGERVGGADHGTRWKFLSDLIGVVRVDGYTDANTVTATVLKAIPAPCVTNATYRWSEGAWSARRGYPACLLNYDRRLWSARTPGEPRAVWASAIGDFADFAPSVEADGAFAYSIDGGATQNAIEWLAEGNRGIYIGALGEVRRGFSSSTTQGIGPTTFDTELVSSDGAYPSAPVAPYGFPIHMTKGGRRVQELRYSFEQDGAKPIELSLPAQHLGSLGLQQIVWKSTPINAGWLRAGDGSLVYLSYDPNQDVLGWAVIPVADGFVEDMDVTPGANGDTDVLTLVVRRTVDGEVRRFVEEQALIYGVLVGNQPIADALHLFASSQFTADPETDTFSVPHLAGESVYAWTDKGQYGPLTVQGNGTVILPDEVGQASIGLFDPTHYAETLDIVAAAPDGNTRGRKRQLNSPTGVDLHRTAAGLVAPVERIFGQEDYEWPRSELVPTQIAADLSAAYTGTSIVDLATGHCGGVRMRFFPSGGAPMTVTALTPDIDEAAA